MRSLATEQYRELKRLESIKINGRAPRVEMTMGEHGADGRALGDADVVVMTNERLDALMRQDEKWRGRTGLVVVDEVHMIGDAGRGPALETVIAHAMSMDRPPQIVGLSATAPNAKELADWLGATLVKSCWRPVRLVGGVYDGHEVDIDVAEPLRVETAAGYTAALRAGIASAMRDQTILFAGTRPSAVSMAKKAAGALEGRVRKGDRERLAKYSARIKGGSKPTGEVTALIGLVGRGVAFHHAGLDQNCKDAVEAGCRDRATRLVVSTPTLAVGVNLPARRVIISSLSRYRGKAGHQEISVREYMQMAGRAGRPQYDDSGEAIIVTTPEKAGQARARYIEGEPEPVRSQMAGAEPMRAHLLGLVAIYPGIREGKVLEFFLRTLAGMQMGSARMAQVVGDGLQFLCECGFITAEATEGPPSYHPTAMGRRVTRMYLEPSAALKMIRMARMETSGAAHTLGLAYAAVTYGKARKNGIRRQDAEPLGSLLDGHSDELFKRIVDRESDPPRAIHACPVALAGGAQRRAYRGHLGHRVRRAAEGARRRRAGDPPNRGDLEARGKHGARRRGGCAGGADKVRHTRRAPRPGGAEGDRQGICAKAARRRVWGPRGASGTFPAQDGADHRHGQKDGGGDTRAGRRDARLRRHCLARAAARGAGARHAERPARRGREGAPASVFCSPASGPG